MLAVLSFKDTRPGSNARRAQDATHSPEALTSRQGHQVPCRENRSGVKSLPKLRAGPKLGDAI